MKSSLRSLNLLWLLLILLSISNLANGQGPSKEIRGSESFQKFDQLIKKEIEAGKIVGCSAVLMKDDQVLYQNVWGQRDREKELPVEKDTIWRIYSMSKPITSVAVMQLVEKGKIKLDEPVATYLPEFKDLKVLKGDELVECDRPMTVRDLLRHTSGLTYGFFGNTEIDKQYKQKRILVFDKNLKETVTKLSKIPLLHQPGTRFHYSLSTDVLGRVVEVASGKSFKDYLNEHLFKPLKMKDTYFTVPKSKQERFAQLYAPDRGKLKKANSMSSLRFMNENELYSGGGGLCSTDHDYLQFCRMLVNQGSCEGKQLLKPETVQEMFKNQLPDRAGRRGFAFGLGFRISNEKHYSWGGAAGTRFWVDPKNKVYGVYMIQISPFRSRDYGDLFKKASYRALSEAE